MRSTEDDFSQSEWHNLAEWANSHNLPINFSKCSVMDIVTKQSISLRPIFMSDDVLSKSVSSVTILGVTFAADMKWNQHVCKVVSKASRRLYHFPNNSTSRIKAAPLHRDPLKVDCYRHVKK